jgi:RNA polymerase sigma-70 factor (ECF subfamily)
MRALAASAAQDVSRAAADLLDAHRGRLERMVHLRLNRRLQGAVEVGNVLREAREEVARRLPEYLADPRLPVYLWLRNIAGLTLAGVHRRHLGDAAPGQDTGLSLHRGALPGANSISLAAHLLGTEASPSEEVVRVERRIQIQEALNGLDPTEREIVALKHFERLSIGEIARVLEISEGEVGKRYLRAIKALRASMSQIPGFKEF